MMTHARDPTDAAGMKLYETRPVDFHWVRRLHHVRIALVGAALLLCGTVLSGHVLGIRALFQPDPAEGGTHILTLASALLLALALAGFRALRPISVPVRLLVALALAVAAGRVGEYALFGPDRPFSDLFQRAGVSGVPVLMGINTALTVGLLAIGMLLRRSHSPAGFLIASSGLFLPLVSILGYIYRVPEFHGAMSPITAVLFLVLALAVICSFAHKRSLRVLLRSDTAGRLARGQIAAAALFFIGCGYLLSGTEAFAGSSHAALVVTVTLWFVTGMVIVSSQAYERADAKRRQMERRLAVNSLTEPLTGIANRRAGQEMGQVLFEQALRTGEGLGAILIDLDHFKRINDTHGHATGDVLLRQVAQVLEGRLRRSDTVARWGGEEFLVLLPGAGEIEAVRVAEELRRLIFDQVQLPLGDRVYRVTASFGVTARSLGDRSLEALIQRAHAALYKAKDRGRNRVVGCRDLARATVGACPVTDTGDDCPSAAGAPGPGTPACGGCPLDILPDDAPVGSLGRQPRGAA